MLKHRHKTAVLLVPLTSLFPLFLLFSLLLMQSEAGCYASDVRTMRAPEGGLQPQAAVDAKGELHLIYFKGDLAHGDLFYVHRPLASKSDFSVPIRVNRTPGNAIALGTIRGAQVAIGKENRVHVAWNGSDKAEHGPGGSPMLYTHLTADGKSFVPEKNLIVEHGGIDGGGAIAADDQGNVFVAWHITPVGRDEAAGAVYLARSTDNGNTFDPERRITTLPTGACGCCGMRAFVASNGTLFLLYRAAERNEGRDTTLLTSRNQGITFRQDVLDCWPTDTCPMSSYSLAESRGQVLAAWEDVHQATFMPVSPIRQRLPNFAGRPSPTTRKYPLLLANAKGEILFAWVEGAGWNRAGTLHWQGYDTDGNLTNQRGGGAEVPASSLITGYTEPNGNFVLLF